MRKQYSLLLLILLLASIFRLFRLDTFPSGLYWEEVALGYDAYSIFKTGKDYHGNPWPIVAFPSFGDYKPSGYFYLTVPFIAIFGLNEWGVRLPSALSGIVAVLLVYLIAIEFFKKKSVAFWSAFTLAIMPWHIQFSRAAFEANVATMWLCAGIWMLLKARSNCRWLLASVLPLTLAMYTYHSARVVVPLLTLAIVIVNLKKLKVRYLISSFLLALLLMWPIIMALKTPAVTQRFAETSYFAHTRAIEKTNLWRVEDENSFLSRATHHRYWYWGAEIVGSIFSHLNPAFLFLTGDKNPRHQTGYFALLFWWMIVPLFLGIKALAQGKKWDILLILLAWFLTAGLAPALTNLAPHTLRFLLAAPFFALVIGYGMNELVISNINKYTYRPILLSFVFLVIALSSLAYSFDYLIRYQNSQSREWQYAYKELMAFVKDRGDQDTQVYITPTYGRPSMYALFYLKYPPHVIQIMKELLPTNQMELQALDKFQFIDPNLVNDGLVISEKPYTRGSLIKQIKFLDEEVAFYVYEI